MKTWTRWVSVDPGVTGTGVAFWEGRRLAQVQTLNCGKGTWEYRANQIAGRFNEEMLAFFPKAILLESPVFFSGSGRVVAARGDLVKLSLLVGMLFWIANQYAKNVYLVLPADWKGQLPKQVCHSRIIRTMRGMGMEKMSGHAWDAIGIGLWQQGRF